MRIERQGLIIWYRHRRNLSQIRRYGHLIYASRKMRYAVLYVNSEDVDSVKGKLKEYKFIRKIDMSAKKHIPTNYDKKDIKEVKEYDFHIGI